MKLFVSYSSAYRDFSERLLLALEAEGHTVFLDREDLAAGESYHAALRQAIEAADRFIFLISPESVAPGSYALAEMGLAQRRWRRPAGRVLPVMIAPTPLASVPPYLKAVTLLQPKGDAVAEIVAAVAGMTGRSRLWMAAAAVLAALGILAGGAVFLRQQAVQRERLDQEVAAAGELCGSGSYHLGWKRFEEIASRLPDDVSVRSAREDCGMRWLRDMRVTSGQTTFTQLVGEVQPVLAQALAGAAGRRAADLRAHLGWADFLRSRDGAAPDPVVSYRRALEDDPQNVYAHAMWAHLLVWTGGNIHAAKPHFAAAVQTGREREFVRRLQFALSLTNDQLVPYAVAVADEMRVNGETPNRDQREGLWRNAFERQLIDSGDRAALLTATTPAALLATFQWLYPWPELRDEQRASWRFCLAALQANAGETSAARAGLEALRQELRSAGSGGRVSRAVDRLLIRLDNSPEQAVDKRRRKP